MAIQKKASKRITKRITKRVPRKVARKQAKQIAKEIAAKAKRGVERVKKELAQSKPVKRTPPPMPKKKVEPPVKRKQRSAPVEEQPATALSELQVPQAVREELAVYCEQHRKLSDEIAAAKEAKDVLLADCIDPLAREWGIENVLGDGWLLVHAKGSAMSLTRENLLRVGVPMKTIEAATVRTPWERYQIRSPKVEEQEDQ